MFKKCEHGRMAICWQWSSAGVMIKVIKILSYVAYNNVLFVYFRNILNEKFLFFLSVLLDKTIHS